MTTTKRTVTRLHNVTQTRALVREVEAYFSQYVGVEDVGLFLPIVLWTMCTYMFPAFDAFPYVVVTSQTKRSGKSRLGVDLMSFVASNARPFGAMTPASMFRIIEQEHPTILFDEAEELNGEAAGAMRSVLNVGYRKGSKVPRVVGNHVKEFDTYCPKVFILIGDVYDTLRDRAIVIRMKRMDAPTRFVYEVAKAQGAELRAEISTVVNDEMLSVEQAYLDHGGIEFLTDRDEEIWTPLFAMCQVMCPERLPELSRIAVDMAMEKTVDATSYVDASRSEDEEQNNEYSLRLLRDLLTVMQGKSLSSAEAVERLRALTTAPWRKFRGEGITMHNMADFLKRFGVSPKAIRLGKGKRGSNANVFKGYRIEDVRTAVHKHDKAIREDVK